MNIREHQEPLRVVAISGGKDSYVKIAGIVYSPTIATSGVAGPPQDNGG